MNARRLVNIAAFSALALAMHFLESMLPPLLPFAPGVKMGLANIFTFLALIFGGGVDALIVQLVRCVLGSVFAGNISALMYSLTAGLISYAVMWLFYTLWYKKFSLMGISLVSSMVHNVVQVLMASLIMESPAVLYYIPYVVLVGSAAGLFTGAVVFFVVKYGSPAIWKAMTGKKTAIKKDNLD